MALTDLSIYLEPPQVQGTMLPSDGLIEFSRNERGRETVKLRLMPTPNDGTNTGEIVTIKMFKSRRDGTEEVTQARKTFTFSGATPMGGAEVSWDLREIVYDTKNLFPVVRRGDYFFEVTHTGPVASSLTKLSDVFRVALMTSDRLEAEWLRGTTRRSNDDRGVRFQPKIITGVRVIEVSKSYPLDLYPLRLVKGKEATPVWFLSWDGGELIRLDTSITQAAINASYILPNRTQQDYIVVQVDPRLLPTSDTTEQLMVDRELLDRDSLRRWIDAECQWLEESYLHTPIEPALCVSDMGTSLSGLGSMGQGSALTSLPNNNDYDLLGPPITMEDLKPGQWINMRVPFGYPLEWEYFEGAQENRRVVSVRVDALHTGIGHHVELVPFTNATAYQFIGLHLMSALYSPRTLPSFWRYRYWAGIPNPVTPMPIIEIIGMRAAVKALMVLGQMFRGGYSSLSMSRDGVHQSASFTSSAMYGIYSATIEGLEKRLQTLQLQLKRKYFGIYADVL